MARMRAILSPEHLKYILCNRLLCAMRVGCDHISIPISAKKREGCFDHPNTCIENVSVRLTWARVMATKQLRRSSYISKDLSPFLRAAQLGS